MATNKNNDKSSKSASTSKTDSIMVLGSKNYKMLGASFLLLILGFILMSGSEDVVDVKSVKLTIAPIVVMLGFILAIVSIMMPEKKQETKENN